jgi:protein disulfide-isomerase
LLETLDAAVLRRRPDLSARVLIWHLIERAGRPGAETPLSRRHRLYDRLMALLDSGKATFSTLSYLLVGLDPVVGFLCEEDDGRRGALNQALHDFSEGLVGDRTLSWTERLIAQAATLKLASTDSPQLVERTRALVMSADAETPEPVERQSVMNMAGHLLRQCGLVEDSIHLFHREIERSPWPTYFMPYVAEMRMERGEREEALRWWRRAYEETPGKNTRFELGVRCVEALVRHAAAERGPIESLVTRLLAERGDDADATRGRMRRSFGQLARTLADWRP